MTLAASSLAAAGFVAFGWQAARADVTGGSSIGVATADVAVGTVFALSAAASTAAPWRQRLLGLGVGAAWLVGSFTAFVTLYAAVLAHALLAYPSGRVTSTRRRLLALAGYASSVVWNSAGVAAIDLAATAAIAWEPKWRLPSAHWAVRRFPTLAAAGVAAILGAEWVLRAGSGVVDPGAQLAAYEMGLALVAGGFAITSRRQGDAPREAVDLALRLNPEPGLPALAGALRSATGDQNLVVVPWDGDAGAFIDGSDDRLDPERSPEPGAHVVAANGVPVALVRHSWWMLSEPGLMDAVDSAIRLAARHLNLREQERQQIADLISSRRRVMFAVDAVRAQIARRLAVAVHQPVLELDEALSELDAVGPVRNAREQLTSVAAQLDALTHGLRPRELDRGGLGAALAELAGRSALPVRLRSHLRGGTDPAVEAAAYFVCAESLANVIKYARAGSVEILAEEYGPTLRVVVTDDGVGGADPSAGTGLSGLVDRVSVLGGSLTVDSQAGGGTTVTAVLPRSADPLPGM